MRSIAETPARHALIFLRTTADTEPSLTSGPTRCFGLSGPSSPELDCVAATFRKAAGKPLADAALIDIAHMSRARRLLLQTLVYLACALRDEASRGSAAVACSFYSRGAFPAFLWAGVLGIEEFASWGEDYLHIQRRQIEEASEGRDIGHCEFLLDAPYRSDLRIESQLSVLSVWIKDYRAPRVLLLAGTRRALERMARGAQVVDGVSLVPRTPVTPCNAAHLPLVDPAPQAAFLRSVGVHKPSHSIVAQADATTLSQSASDDEVRAFILKTAVGPMRTFEAISRLASLADETVAVGTLKSFSALCTESALQLHPIGHLSIGGECHAFI